MHTLLMHLTHYLYATVPGQVYYALRQRITQMLLPLVKYPVAFADDAYPNVTLRDRISNL